MRLRESYIQVGASALVSVMATEPLRRNYPASPFASKSTESEISASRRCTNVPVSVSAG